MTDVSPRPRSLAGESEVYGIALTALEHLSVGRATDDLNLRLTTGWPAAVEMGSGDLYVFAESSSVEGGARRLGTSAVREKHPAVPVTGDRNFRRLWAANAFGDIGEDAASVALSLTAVTLLHAEPWQVAIIAALNRAAYLVLGIPIGVWVDHLPKRGVLICTDLLRAVIVLSIPVAWVLHALSIWQLMVCTALLSTANVFFDVAHTAIVPLIVGKDHVSEASARLQSTDSTTEIIVPAAAGQLATLTAAPVPYFATAVTHLLSSFFAWRMRPEEEPRKPAAEREPFWSAVRAGVAFTLQEPTLRVLVTIGALVNFGAGMYNSQYALYILRHLELPANAYGLALSIGAVGGVVGSLIGVRVKNALGPLRAQVTCYALLTIPFVGLTLAPAHGLAAFPYVTIVIFLLSVLIVVASISSVGVFARLTPSSLLGRVTSARRFITIGAVPLGALAGGLIASVWSSGVVFDVAAAAPLSALVVYLLSPIRRIRDIPTSA